MNRTEMLAKFIVKNWHFCPVPGEVEEDKCCGWQEEGCEKCIVRHAAEMAGEDRHGSNR